MLKSWPTFVCSKKGARKFWSHEWTKHGTCSESVLDMHAYFAAALKLKDKVDLLQTLKNAGILGFLLSAVFPAFYCISASASASSSSNEVGLI
jgi:hypothetical protein